MIGKTFKDHDQGQLFDVGGALFEGRGGLFGGSSYFFCLIFAEINININIKISFARTFLFHQDWFLTFLPTLQKSR